MALISRNTSEISQVRLTDLLKPSDQVAYLNWVLIDELQEREGMSTDECSDLVKDMFTETLEEWENAYPEDAEVLRQVLCTKYGDGANIIIGRPMYQALRSHGFMPLSDPGPDPGPDLRIISRLDFGSRHSEEISRIASLIARLRIPRIYNTSIFGCNGIGPVDSLFITQALNKISGNCYKPEYSMVMKLYGNIRIHYGDDVKNTMIASCRFYLA